MNILIKVTDKEILDQLDKKNIVDYIEEKDLIPSPTYTADQLYKMLVTTIENDSADVDNFLLTKITNSDIENYLKDSENYFISDDVSEFMRQINQAGYMDDLLSEFKLEYQG